MYATAARKMATANSLRTEKMVRIDWLRREVSRIASVTLSGVFVKAEDRAYWVERLRKLSGELDALEQSVKQGRIAGR